MCDEFEFMCERVEQAGSDCPHRKHPTMFHPEPINVRHNLQKRLLKIKGGSTHLTCTNYSVIMIKNRFVFPWWYQFTQIIKLTITTRESLFSSVELLSIRVLSSLFTKEPNNFGSLNISTHNPTSKM